MLLRHWLLVGGLGVFRAWSQWRWLWRGRLHDRFLGRGLLWSGHGLLRLCRLGVGLLWGGRLRLGSLHLLGLHLGGLSLRLLRLGFRLLVGSLFLHGGSLYLLTDGSSLRLG